jgi:hypothetical protein
LRVFMPPSWVCITAGASAAMVNGWKYDFPAAG